MKLIKKIVRVSNLNYSSIDKTPDLVPSIKDLRAFSKLQLSKHRLEKILYWIYHAEIAKLTFLFTGDKRSPPLGTYSSEPNQEQRVPETSISMILFKTWHDGYNYSMNFFGLLDHKNQPLLEI